MHCWSCGNELTDVGKKISFKATCEHCHAWLHVCKNCKHYSPGKPNDCAVPGTEFVADREKFNLCEEFSVLGLGPSDTPKTTDIEKRLFGNEENPKKRRFDELF